MTTYVDRAREIAKRLHTGMVWVDADAEQEIANLLETLAAVAETQARNITSIEFALTYYGESAHYEVGIDDECILDYGLRARTALGLLKRVAPSPTSLYGETS